MKKWLVGLIVVVVVLVALGMAKDVVIRGVVQTMGSQIVGAPIKVGHFSSSIVFQKVHIKRLRLYNPPGYPSEPMLDIPEIRVDADLFSLMKGKLHFPLVIFDLKEVVIIKDRAGELNVNALKVSRQKPEAEKTRSDDKTQKSKSSPMPMRIDVMKLNMERVIFKDYTKGDQPVVQVFELNLKDKIFKDIQSPEQLASVIMINALGPAGLQSAGVYAASTLLGVGFLPAGVAGVLLGKDDAVQEFSQPVEKVFAQAVSLFQETGLLKSKDSAKGIVKGIMDGADVTLVIKKSANKKTEVTASARKLLIPKPDIAGGTLYRLSERVK